MPALPAGVMLTRVSNFSIVLETANGLVPDAFENLLGSIQYTIGQQRYSMYASSGINKRMRRTLTFSPSYMLPVDYFMLHLIHCLYVMSVMSCASILRTA